MVDNKTKAFNKLTKLLPGVRNISIEEREISRGYVWEELRLLCHKEVSLALDITHIDKAEIYVSTQYTKAEVSFVLRLLTDVVAKTPQIKEIMREYLADRIKTKIQDLNKELKSLEAK